MSDPAATASVPEQPEPRRYDLFLRHRGGLFWKLTDEGIMPGVEKLSYTQDGRWGYRPYADIDAINLSSALVYRQGKLAQCAITFRNGSVLNVGTWSDRGLPDASRHEAFFDFITDLHHRLIVSGDARRIRFSRGNSPGRSTVLRVALVAAAGLFIVLPLILAAIARSWEPLQMVLFGALFVWPAWETATKNEPGSYSPKYPPDMLE